MPAKVRSSDVPIFSEVITDATPSMVKVFRVGATGTDTLDSAVNTGDGIVEGTSCFSVVATGVVYAFAYIWCMFSIWWCFPSTSSCTMQRESTHRCAIINLQQTVMVSITTCASEF